jgi:steroid 5-alpha reductase family enzyme
MAGQPGFEKFQYRGYFLGNGFCHCQLGLFVLTPDGIELRKLLLGALVTILGLRLSIHILVRNWRKPEDFRYQKWRKEAGGSWWWQSYMRVFLLQGLLMWIISIPLLAVQQAALPGYLTIFDILGVILWAIGFYFEAMGDSQLARFKSNPAGL